MCCSDRSSAWTQSPTTIKGSLAMELDCHSGEVSVCLLSKTWTCFEQISESYLRACCNWFSDLKSQLYFLLPGIPFKMKKTCSWWLISCLEETWGTICSRTSTLMKELSNCTSVSWHFPWIICRDTTSFTGERISFQWWVVFYSQTKGILSRIILHLNTSPNTLLAAFNLTLILQILSSPEHTEVANSGQQLHTTIWEKGQNIRDWELVTFFLQNLY